MNRQLLLAALLSTLALVACERQPTVINMPPSTVPGPAGPAGATGAQGMSGNTGSEGLPGQTGATGKPGEATTVVVLPVPAASAAAN